jgi:PKD repeat protein
MKKLWTFFILVVLLFSYGNKVNAQYCTTGLYTTGCTDADDIDDFSFNTIIQTATGCGTNGYSDFTALSTPIVPGTVYTMTLINTYGSAYVKVWIDLNDDYTFDDATELMALSNTSMTSAATLFSTSVTIPASAISSPGSHRMRVRLVYYNSTFTACGSYSYGETHDYTVVIPAPNPPVTEFSASTVTPVVDQIVTFTDASTNYPTTWLWAATPATYSFESGTTSASQNPQIKFTAAGAYTIALTATNSAGSNTMTKTNYITASVPAVAPVADFTASNLTPTTAQVVTFTNTSTNGPTAFAWVFTPNTVTYQAGTTAASMNPQVKFNDAGIYTVALTASNTAGSNTMTKTAYINVSMAAYCNSIPSNGADEEIYSVTVNGATNAYGCTTVAPGPGSLLNRYSNFYPLGPLTSMSPGATISFTVEENECDGATYYSNGCAIWIDWNRDGDFLDADEKVYGATETTTIISPRTITGSFTVPLTAVTGLTGLRVIVCESTTGAALTPCQSYSYGETEDYIVNIIPATPQEYTSSTAVTPSTASVIVGSTNNVVLKAEVVMTGSLTPLQLSSMTFSTNGSTNALADITNVKLWKSGVTNNIASAVRVGAGDSIYNPNGTFTFNLATPLALSHGTNYFWLSYDINPAATANDVVDAEFTSLSFFGGSTHTPTVTAPAGNRTIKTPLSGVYTIDNTLPTAGLNYTNFTDAANDLNILGIAGPVTFNVTAGQTFPMTVGTAPANYAFAIVTTGKDGMPIIFQKSGAGINPVISVTGTAATNDIAIFNYGADSITFNGIDITDAGTSSANWVDYGYYLQGTATNGCSYNNIINCNVTLNKSNATANGILINSQATAAGGKNNYNKFYNNTISKASYGYRFLGKSGYYDIKNEIGTQGGQSLITGIGSGVAAISRGIDVGYQDSIQIFNTVIENISSTGGTYPGLCGIAMTNPMSNFNIYGDTIRLLSGSTDPIGINFNTSPGVNTVRNCVFTDFTATAGNINVLRNEGSAMGTTNIYNNVLKNMTNANGEIEGIYINSATTFNVYNNRVYNFANNSVGTQGIDGIFCGNSSLLVKTLYNNLIYDLKAPSSTGAPSVRGIKLAGSTTTRIYNNTIYLDYTSLVATNQSACIYGVATPTSLDMRNNIVINKTDVTTGLRAVAFWWANTVYTNISSSTENNLYFVGMYPSSHIFYNGTTAYTTLAQYKAALGTKDQSAKTEDVPFVSGMSPYDLNIQTTVETQAESGASVIAAITTDINGTPRFPATGYPDNVTKPATAPDLGAIEFGGLAKDLTPPAISFTDLSMTADLASRTFTATITDQGGVNAMPYFSPRVYYKKFSHANTFVDNTNATDGWKYVETTSTTSPFSFTMDYSLLYSTPVVGDTLQYFVVAQDVEMTPNAGAFVANFTVQPLNVELASANFPVTGSIKQFKFVNAINGTILVGAGNPFNCLTCAGDTSVFKYINNNVVTGNLELKITSNLSETGVTALNQFLEEGTGNYTLSIVPNMNEVDTIKGSYSGALIRLNGADRVTVDGRFAGEGKYLTFVNTGTSGSVFGLISLGAGLGSTNNTIRNCEIYMGGNGSGTYGISIGGATNGSTGSNNHNNSILNNNISKVYVGVFAQGNVVPGLMDNLNVSGNVIGHDSTSMYLGHDGIIVAYTMGTTIAENKIFNIVNTNTTSKGISLLTETKNTNVSKNYIDNLKYTGTGGYGSYGLYISTGNATSNIDVTNNVINRISGDGWSSFGASSPVGILIDGITGGINFYYNTVNMNDVSTRTSQIFTAAFALNTTTITNLNVKNNIFSNTFRSTGNMTSLNYSIYTVSPISAFTSINNNLYAINDTSIQGRVAGSGTTFGAVNYLTLADWQAATSQDANSVSANAQFTSDTDLTPLMTSPALTAGTPIAGVTTDITGKVRALFTPTIGAYEITALKTLNLTLFLQGLYNGTNMNEAQDDMGSHWGTGIADHIDVELRNGTTSALEQAFTGQVLNTDGTCTVTIPSSMGDSYYIAIKHRNSIATWSALPISFGGTAINYNFTTDITMAFADNMKEVATGVYALYVGDVNQDEVIDLSDLVDMDTDLTNGTVAYVVYDLNGDGVVDLSDLVAIDENLTNGVVSMYP